MALVLFDNRNFGGTSSNNIAGDRADLRNSRVGNSTSSARTTARGDRLLLYTRPNWDGRA